MHLSEKSTGIIYARHWFYVFGATIMVYLVFVSLIDLFGPIEGAFAILSSFSYIMLMGLVFFSVLFSIWNVCHPNGKLLGVENTSLHRARRSHVLRGSYGIPILAAIILIHHQPLGLIQKNSIGYKGGHIVQIPVITTAMNPKPPKGMLFLEGPLKGTIIDEETGLTLQWEMEITQKVRGFFLRTREGEDNGVTVINPSRILRIALHRTKRNIIPYTIKQPNAFKAQFQADLLHHYGVLTKGPCPKIQLTI